jgi:hypothetical protein
MSNCFFLRQRQDTLVYFSSVSFVLIESLRCIQQSLHSIFNTNRIGQVLKGFRRIWLSPIAWIYLTERLASLGVVTLRRQGRRTKRIIGAEFVKQSHPITINIEKEGRYIGLGTRVKFPKSGQAGIPVHVGAMMHIVSNNNYIEFEYIQYNCELKITATFVTQVATENTTW